MNGRLAEDVDRPPRFSIGDAVRVIEGGPSLKGLTAEVTGIVPLNGNWLFFVGRFALPADWLAPAGSVGEAGDE